MKKTKHFHIILAIWIVFAFFCVFRISVSAAEGNVKTYHWTWKYYVSGNPVIVNSEVSTTSRLAIYRLSTSTNSNGDIETSFVRICDGNSNILLEANSFYTWYDSNNNITEMGTSSSSPTFYSLSNVSSNATPYSSSEIGYSTDIPMFDTLEAVQNYIDTGDDTEQINKINYDSLTEDKPLFSDFADFDFTDTDTNYLKDFKLEGFKSDYFINAAWSSIHIPDKLQQWINKGTIDMDDVAVMVMFTYRNKNYPETDSYIKYYPTLIKANSLESIIKISDFQPEFDTYYLSDVAFIPVVEFTYYNSGMGTSMKPLNLMYYGSINHVYYNYDGSAGGADFDSGDINGDKNGGFALGDDGYSGFHGITGDITDALDQFSSLLDSLSGSVSRVANFASAVFSWLPSWAYLLIGGAVAACFLLRFIGR